MDKKEGLLPELDILLDHYGSEVKKFNDIDARNHCIYIYQKARSSPYQNKTIHLESLQIRLIRV